MRKRVFMLLLGICLVFSGCKAQPPRHRVVCQITVIRQGQARTYTASDKMTRILNGLRSLGQKTRAQLDPDTLSIPGCQIILQRTDGSSTIYQLKGERYIRQDNAPWQQTDPQALSELTSLLSHLPPDVN